MKKIFSFTKKKKYPSGTPDNGSVLSVGYDLKDKDLGKVHKAASVGDLAKLKQLAKKSDINQLDKENRTALHIACASGHVEVVQFLVESKAKLNLCDNQNRSALMKAVQGQHERCVNILLENHAEPDLIDINGNTALHLAANIPSISTARLLLEHEADLNAPNKEGFTPLSVAVREDHIEMAEFLLKEGADVNFTGQEERSPLMMAAGNGQIAMLRLLLRYDADITLKDSKGWSADDYAVMNGHHPCSLLIIEHGTQKNDGSSLLHQDGSKKKKKILLGSPSQDAEAGFSLGGPATDKDEHGSNEAGRDFEDNSQSESLSRVSKSAADEWPSSDNDEESVSIEKKPQKVNLRKMIATKKGEADHGAEQGKRKRSEQPSSSKAKSEGSPEAENSEEEEEEEEDDDEEDDEEEEEEEEEDDDEEEEDDEEEDEEEDEEDEEEEDEEDEGEEDNECEEDNDKCVASVETAGFEDIPKPSPVSNLKKTNSANTQKISNTDNLKSHVSSLDHAPVGESVNASENAAKTETQTDDSDRPVETSHYAIPVTLGIEEDCIVSAIRVESKFSDEDDSVGKECMWTSGKNVKSGRGSAGSSKTSNKKTLSPIKPEEKSDKEMEKDDDENDDDLWSKKEDTGDTVWNDSDDEENQTGGLGRNTVLAKLRNISPEHSHSDVEDVSNEEGEKKRRSSWGSSLDSDTDLANDDQGNEKIPEQKRDLKATKLFSEDALPQPNEDHHDTSRDTPRLSSSKCVSPQRVMGKSMSPSKLSSASSPRSLTTPAKAAADESDWDSSSENHDVKYSRSPNKKGPLSAVSGEDAGKVTREPLGSAASFSKKVQDTQRKKSHDPSPTASPAKQKLQDSENPKDDDNSWDDDEDDSNQECMPTFSSQSKGQQSQKTGKDLSKFRKTKGSKDNKNIPLSVIDGNDDFPETRGLEEEKPVGVKKGDPSKDETDEDSDSMDEKLQYDFVSSTMKLSDVGDDSVRKGHKLEKEQEARLISYVPLQTRSAIATKTTVSVAKLREVFSRPLTKDSGPAGQQTDSDGNTFSDEALPQTDIDDVDIDSPDESLGMKCPEIRNTEEYPKQKDDSTEDEDDQNDEKDDKEDDVSEDDEQPEESGDSRDAISPIPEGEVCKDKKRDFLSELGLDRGDEGEQESWDSESGSENPKLQHEENQSVLTKDQEEIPTVKEDNKETVSSSKADNGGAEVDKDDTTQRETEKAKWEPLLSKLEGGSDRKTDLMEELGLGDVDDLEAQKADASDWDSASTTSKRTLPGRRVASPGLEEFPESFSSPIKEEGEGNFPTSTLTPQSSIKSNKRSLPTLSQMAPHPQPRARKMVPQKPESQEDSDWESDDLMSPSKTEKPDNHSQETVHQQAEIRPDSAELTQRCSEGHVEAEEQQQKIGKGTAKTSLREQKSSASWDTGGIASEDVGAEKLETMLGCRKEMSSQTALLEQQPADIKSTNGAPVQLQLPLQQTYIKNKQDVQAVEETIQLELVRGAQRSRAPQTNTHINGDPLSVFDDTSLSEVSDDEGRMPTEIKQKNESPDEVEMAEDFDELTQSSDTATDDLDSPTAGYRHASLLIQKLDSATLDSRSMVKLQNIFHEYERSIQKLKSRHGYLADKVSQLEMERVELKSSLDEMKDVKSALERNQLELQTEVTNLKFQLKQEQENRRNATMMYNTTKDKLKRTEEHQQFEVQERQKVELTLRNLELEMRTLVNNMKQLEEDHSETQRLLAQERSARALQENLLSSHLRKQQEIEEESKRNISRSNEALTQLTEASDREKELLQQTATLQEQLTILRADLERSQASSSLKESHLLEENEGLKEHLEDARRDLKLNSEALTQTVFNCNNQLTGLKSELTKMTAQLENERQNREALETEVESVRTRLAGAVQEAERCLAAHADTEKALLREKEETQRLKDRLTGEAVNQRDTVSSLSQKLSKAEAQTNSMENEVHRVTLQLTEKGLLLDVLQREKDQAAARVKELETLLQAEKELVTRAGARHEATQERLAQAQSEVMLLRQQLEEAQNKGDAKERAVTDAQERFSDILAKLRSDCEERVQLVEERNKELASKAADLRDQIYKLEEEKNERETSLRQMQQELADSLKKLSMSEASLEVNTRYRSDLEEEKGRFLKDIDRLKGKLEESEDQYVQAEKRINALKTSLDEREKELTTAAHKLQEALSASAVSDTTIKQLEEAVQKLEIENARLEAAAKQQSNKIDALQKGAQEAAMPSDCTPGGGVRGHLEDLVTNLQSSKMTLEDQLSREVQKQSMLSHTAQDSQALWEEELKSRSKLGLRLAELEKEKGELTSQMEIEKKKAKKIAEQKKSVDSRLEQEMNRNTELQKEMLRTLLKTAKKKLRDQDMGGAEFGSPMGSLRMDMGRYSQADGRMKEKVDDLQMQLERETSRRSQLEKANDELKDQLASLKRSNHSSEQLERSKHQLEEELLDLRRRLEAAQAEQNQVDHVRRDAEDRARQEIQQKLEQVNLFLQTQAASQEALDQIKAANEANLRSQLEHKIRELENELGRVRSTQQDSLNQREMTRTELDRYRQLYGEELRLRKSLAAKLERSNSRLSDANSKLLSERSRSLIASSFANSSLGGPSLDRGSLGPLNRSLGLGLSLLNPVSEGQSSRVEDYLAKMQSELDRNISKELSNATAELDVASARMSPVGSASRVDLDPLSRAKQQYLEVLKKNHRI
ncbi:ankyrin repeat domain-containing protein 26 isoform X3 [Sphaeramia orbicularis]|uniref:ankyrin repeat domain-containing protein 26 isoform X3 n=1 Tax=Sphaeramia orbicularis TaxID=375764 RepID=UPI00117FC0B8|nr:ankyrin repeat domain-containing protein 26-like isoform X3 [Sphaeramia orbicularis]